MPRYYLLTILAKGAGNREWLPVNFVTHKDPGDWLADSLERYPEQKTILVSAMPISPEAFARLDGRVG